MVTYFQADFLNLFQIVYKGGLLYIYATNEECRERWLAALHKGNTIPLSTKIFK